MKKISSLLVVFATILLGVFLFSNFAGALSYINGGDGSVWQPESISSPEPVEDSSSEPGESSNNSVVEDELVVAPDDFGPLGDGDFMDIDGHEYKESIEYLFSLGVVKGYGNGKFMPDQSVSRAELLKMIFESLDRGDELRGGGCFIDVQTEWFAPYVCLAKNEEVVNGYDDGKFRPNQGVNMVEALKIAVEAFGLNVGAEIEGEWFEKYRNFSHVNNIFSRYSYLPGKSANRGEVAFMLQQMLKIKNGVTLASILRDPRSSGCGKKRPFVAPTKFMIDGVEREVIFSLPANYDSNTPYSLVFAFHGRTSPNYEVKQYYKIENASKGQAIFVYPAGVKRGSSFTWSNGGDSAGALRDYQLFDEMYEEYLSSYCINEDEVFVAGHSLGGWFSNSLACARGDKIRAVASLGGSISSSECSGPVAVMQWHNPNDRLASFSSGVVAKNAFLKQNECSSQSEVVYPFWGNCVEYSACEEDSPVVWCPHTEDYDGGGNYYPHNWPKAAGEEMWKFFEKL